MIHGFFSSVNPVSSARAGISYVSFSLAVTSAQLKTLQCHMHLGLGTLCELSNGTAWLYLTGGLQWHRRWWTTMNGGQLYKDVDVDETWLQKLFTAESLQFGLAAACSYTW